MARAKIKIVSDPYARSVTFCRWDGDWIPITLETNPNSKLLGRGLAEGFLPFMVKEVVDTVLDEYRIGDEVVELVFEGPDDEYGELCSFCESGRYPTAVSIARSERRLPVACDVLPEIVEVFKGVRPLVDAYVLGKQDLSDELERFEDVSSDVVPLCVFGNCSAGKSTFINALIGYELLPNGDEPVTARVYQIRRSKQPGRGIVDFGYDGSRISLEFGEGGISANAEFERCELFPRVQSALAEVGEPGLIPHMNRVLRVLNNFRSAEPERGVSDRIDVTVPFNPSDPWADSRDFVICDTPGSNTVTHEDHLRVLRSALEGMSNGLPIYVAELDSLDTTDNESLYDEIERIDAVDERFAMIVVNKADVASLPKGGFSPEKVLDIKTSAVPSHLYAQGIYFVSSILGLGTKLDGAFESENYAERYEDQAFKYSNPEHPRYKMLYRYNILPGQIGERVSAESEAFSIPAADGGSTSDEGRLLFANSGLYCVEQEVRRFAEKYSAYNKCHQSEVLLRRIIDVTSEEIEAEKARKEESRRALSEKLETEKAELKGALSEAGASAEREAVEGYPLQVDDTFNPSRWSIGRDSLLEKEDELTEEMRKKIGYDEFDDDAKLAWKTIGVDFLNDFSAAFDKQNADLLASTFVRLANNLGIWRDKQVSLYDADRRADGEASDALIEEVKRDFDRAVDSMAAEIQSASQAYWGRCSDEARSALKEIATTNTVLSEERRMELEDIIVHYPPLTLACEADDIFVTPAFKRGFRLWNMIIAESAKLNLGRLKNVYNEEIAKALSEVRGNVRASHEQSFKDWLHELLHIIVENITDYNPYLHGYVVAIKEHDDRIEDLETKLDRLEGYEEQISQMIGWRE